MRPQVVLGPLLYVVGGSYGGRSLNDIQTFDLRTGEWNRVAALPQDTMLPIAGHKCALSPPPACDVFDANRTGIRAGAQLTRFATPAQSL
jgi:hypothetical protein